MTIKSALVVGGGIVGLVAARALALQGIATTLIERKPRIVDDGGIGIGIQNNAMNALAEVGLAQRVVAEGVPVDTIEVLRPDGKTVAERAPERWCGSPWPGFTGITRAALHAVLAGAAAEAGVELRTGTEVVGVDPAAGTIRTAGGGALGADMVIAADGIYSHMRSLLFPAHARAVRTGEGVWRAKIAGVRKHRVQMMFGAGVGTIGLTPLKRDTYLYVVDRDDRAPPRDAEDLPDRLFALIGHAPGFPQELAARLSPLPGDVTYRALEAVVLPPPWFDGRVLLIGDAAHAGPPTLAQGAAMGIEDGVVLARLLSAANTPFDAFAAFMERRWHRVSTIVEASLTISRAQMYPGGQQAMIDANRVAAQTLALPY